MIRPWKNNFIDINCYICTSLDFVISRLFYHVTLQSINQSKCNTAINKLNIVKITATDALKTFNK